ncbi:MAG: DNA methyltransferase [Coleofasciculaceae cyanobacterium]
MTATPANLQAFVTFALGLRGDEKGESQTFLDRFFRAFGHEGAIEAGAEFEDRLKKASAKGKMGFADLVWRSRLGVPGVLIEMKKRGEDLSKHYAQVERYWMRITPNRPRYAMLCNFNEFWIFDFENQVDEPVDKILLEQLPERAGALTFMEIGGMRPVFQNNQVEVTDRSARRLGQLYQLIYQRGKKRGFRDFSEEQLQRFILQCVLAMFAEDRDLLPRDIFVSLIQDCLESKGSTYDLIGGLFQEMNRKGKTPAGRFKGVDYFNGGLFSEIDPIELIPEELKLLDVCARDNWTNVRPSIFGNIFEGAIDATKRHAHGIHFTSEVDIRQIVRPTISDYWEERINSAGTIRELNALQLELQAYRVLDPACGSGNFLYVAYQELKRLEKLLIDKTAEKKRSPSGQIAMGYVTPLQFFGMDTNPFAVQLARVTMMIGRKIAIDKLGLTENALPLDTLDNNIVCNDALFSEWEKADAIIGNPPFLGGKQMRIVLGDDYIDQVFGQFKDVKDSVDFCSYWFRLAHEHIDENGRAGLVGTNSISQGKSRRASLDYITQNNGYIHEAISTQPWSGEAKGHVSLVNWSKQQPKSYHLDNKVVSKINSSLTANIDVSEAARLQVNLNQCFQGVIPVGKGFIVTEEQVKAWIKADSKNKNILKLFSMGANLAQNPHGKPERWIIDFSDMSLEDASDYKLPFQHVKVYVKPERDGNRREVTRLNWWKYGEKRPAMRKAIANLSYYFAVPELSKWAIFVPCSRDWLPGNNSHPAASDDFYIFGILTSQVHRTWVKAQSSTLEDRTRYTHKTCFETFPFPQSPNKKLIEQIRAAAQELHDYRTEQMEKKQWGITQLYNQFFHEPSSQLFKLHAKLDQLVMQAYEFKSDDDILAKLLELNLELAEKEKRGKTIVGPWSPDRLK